LFSRRNKLKKKLFYIETEENNSVEPKKPYIHYLSLVIIALLSLIYSCYEPKLKSKWRDRDIAIDGIDKEWEDCRLYYDKDTQTAIGLFNDKDNLYIHFSTSDRMIQRQMIEQGFTIWFDSTGGKDKKLGIFYPTGIMDKQIPKKEDFDKNSDTINRNPPREAGHEPPEFDGDRDLKHRNFQNPSLLLDDLLKDMSDAIDIKLSDGSGDWDTYFLENEHISGIQAKVRQIQGRLVYELKMPIVQNDHTPNGIVVSKRGKIGVGFETAEIEAPFVKGGGSMGGGMGGPGGGGSRDGDMERSEGGMGPPGGGMGRPGGRGGRRGSFKNQQAEPLELWTKVYLASRP
jgi:hypothetical protein